MKNESLQFYVDRLKRKPFSLIRFGDGELYCAWGRGGRNSNGCDYTPELRDDLNKILQSPKEGVIYGLQRVLPEDQKRAEQYAVEWHDSEVFGDAMVAGELYPIIQQLKKMRVVFISNPDMLDLDIFPIEYFIQTPHANTHAQKKWIYDEIEGCKGQWPSGTVYIFCCGMAGTVFPYELHDGKNFFLDLGHIFDAAVGKLSRFNMQKMTVETITQNYYGRESH